MFRKVFKPIIYSAILIIPLFLFLLRPKSFNTSPVLDAVSRPIGAMESAAFEIRKLMNYHDTYDEYFKMKKKLDVLISRNVYLQENLRAAKRYDQMMEFRRKESFISLTAFVIGRDPSNWNASLILDKGKADGIKVGMPVLSPLGVVGKVVEVGHKTCKVILLSDSDFSVAAVVARTRESGLLSGTLQGICRLHYLTEKADVKVGDQVVTSKLSSSFPEGILIGIVTDVQAASNTHTVECLVDPVVDLSQIEEVLIVK